MSNQHRARVFLENKKLTIYEIAFQAIAETSPAYDYIAESLDLSDEAIEEIRGFLRDYLES